MLTCTPPLSLDGAIEDRPTEIRPKLDCAIYYLCDVRLIPGLLWGAFFPWMVNHNWPLVTKTAEMEIWLRGNYCTWFWQTCKCNLHARILVSREFQISCDCSLKCLESWDVKSTFHNPWPWPVIWDITPLGVHRTLTTLLNWVPWEVLAHQAKCFYESDKSWPSWLPWSQSWELRIPKLKQEKLFCKLNELENKVFKII